MRIVSHVRCDLFERPTRTIIQFCQRHGIVVAVIFALHGSGSASKTESLLHRVRQHLDRAIKVEQCAELGYAHRYSVLNRDFAGDTEAAMLANIAGALSLQRMRTLLVLIRFQRD